MKKLIILLVLFVSVFLIGCGSGSGVTEDQTVRSRRIAAIGDINDRQIRDDSDELWLVDQNGKLMEPNVYIGK